MNMSSNSTALDLPRIPENLYEDSVKVSRTRITHLGHNFSTDLNLKSHEIASFFSLCFKLLLLVNFYTKNFYGRKVPSPVTEVQESHSMLI